MKKSNSSSPTPHLNWESMPQWQKDKINEVYQMDCSHVEELYRIRGIPIVPERQLSMLMLPLVNDLMARVNKLEGEKRTLARLLEAAHQPQRHESERQTLRDLQKKE